MKPSKKDAFSFRYILLLTTSGKVTLFAVLLCLSLHVVFWNITQSLAPEKTIIANPPGELVVKATAFGDEQWYFRMLGMQMQNAGDLFGEVTPLSDYDYPKLTAWFDLLDTLDSRSHFIPSLASYYYSQTQYRPDVAYIVDYLERHAARHPVEKWWWLYQASALANHRLENKERALELAYQLAAIPADTPLWAKQLPAFLHEQRGEKEESLAVMLNIIENYDTLSEEEKNFMHHFIEQRIPLIENLIEPSP